MSRPTILILPIGAWAFIVGAGVFALAKYEATPGPAPGVRLAVPGAESMASDKMTLLMFVHPKCSCSAASLEELSVLMAQYGSRLNSSVVIFRSSRERDDWSKTPMWRSASAIPGVGVRADVDAVLARRYGAQTSGQVFLFDKRGALVFQGGITGSRGHVGDNDGLNTVTKLIFGQVPAPAGPARAPVFGCAIYSGADDGAGPPLTRGPR